MYCKHCGKQISNTAQFCEHCGLRTSDAQKMQTQIATKKAKNAKIPLYKNGWFWIIIALIIAPFALLEEKDNDGATNHTNPSTIATTAALDARSQFVFEANTAGLSEDIAGQIYDLLETKLLCTSITFISKSSAGNALWEVNVAGYALKVSADNDGIYSVRCGSYEMYDGELVCYTAADLALRDTSEHRTYYAAIAKEIVKNNLKAPSTAEFPWATEFKMQRNGDIVAVSSYVDAQNSFGAIIRSEWTVEFRVINIDLLEYEYETLYVQIGDYTDGTFITLD